jgi:hypothetical protein
MNILYAYATLWMLVPFAGLVIGTRLTLARQWRAAMLFATTVTALALTSLFLADPMLLILSPTDPAYLKITGTGTPSNYYQEQAAVYLVEMLVMLLLTYMRPNISVTLSTTQFWLLHSGVLVSLVPPGLWAVNQVPGSVTPPQNPGMSNTIAAYGSILIVLSMLVLVWLILWTIWSRVKSLSQTGRE